jgi:hypothetical protein
MLKVFFGFQSEPRNNKLQRIRLRVVYHQTHTHLPFPKNFLPSISILRLFCHFHQREFWFHKYWSAYSSILIGILLDPSSILHKELNCQISDLLVLWFLRKIILLNFRNLSSLSNFFQSLLNASLVLTDLISFVLQHWISLSYMILNHSAVSNDRDETFKRIRSLLQELPVSHIDTMNYLFKFLHRFSAHSLKTLMDKRWFWIVF